MRKHIFLLSTVALAACGGGGGGVQSIGAYVPPVDAGGGSNASTEETDPATGEAHSFVDPTKAVTYQAFGGSQHLSYERVDVINPNDVNGNPVAPSIKNQNSTFYDSNSTDSAETSLNVTYDPKDGEFTINFVDPNSTVDQVSTFQDPGQRTDYGGVAEPTWSVPNLTGLGVNYIEGASGDNIVGSDNGYRFTLKSGAQQGTFESVSFFYQRPGTTTNYVTFSGWSTNHYEASRNDDGSIDYAWELERGVATFGEQTKREDAPNTGTASYSGNMIATAIVNDQLDNGAANNFYQWIVGSADLTVDFGATTFNLDVTGTLQGMQVDVDATYADYMPAGSIFNAIGKGRFDGNLPTYRTFSGGFQEASFTRPDGSTYNLDLSDPYATANAIDGSFYGPAAEEVGGTFRISDGRPDHRVDVLGVFIGSQP